MAAPGLQTDAMWKGIAALSCHRVALGEDSHCYRLLYDPNIRAGFVGKEPADVDLWPLYDKVTDCPQGAASVTKGVGVTATL